MTSADSSQVDQGFLANAMASFIQIGAVVLLAMWCFDIVSPFLNVIIWGLIISVALYPVHVGLTARLGGREKLSATLLVLVGLVIILAPTWYLADSTVGGLRHIATDLEDGAVSIPPPAESVADWPLIGERVYGAWSGAATNFEATLCCPTHRNRLFLCLQHPGHTASTIISASRNTNTVPWKGAG